VNGRVRARERVNERVSVKLVLEFGGRIVSFF